MNVRKDHWLAFFWTMCAVLAAACQPKNSAGPAPFRPEAASTEVGILADCEPTNPDAQSAPLRFGERSIAEAARLVERARDEYAEAMTTELSQPLRLEALHRTLETLHTALAADPYNVDATYLLAAAYARVQRKQCTLNLLERLLEMKHHHSRSAAVERRLDSLLGRRGTPLDTSFDGLRRDAGFRELIAEMCRDENDADCVHGAP